MKQYKTGDKVRVSNNIDISYEDAEERIFVYERDGLNYCVCDDHEERFNKCEVGISLMRWRYIIDKPIEYTLKGDELKAVLQSIEPDKISEHLRNDLINVRHELRKLTK